jgi:hypothetical protein
MVAGGNYGFIVPWTGSPTSLGSLAFLMGFYMRSAFAPFFAVLFFQYVLPTLFNAVVADEASYAFPNGKALFTNIGAEGPQMFGAFVPLTGVACGVAGWMLAMTVDSYRLSEDGKRTERHTGSLGILGIQRLCYVLVKEKKARILAPWATLQLVAVLFVSSIGHGILVDVITRRDGFPWWGHLIVYIVSMALLVAGLLLARFLGSRRDVQANELADENMARAVVGDPSKLDKINDSSWRAIIDFSLGAHAFLVGVAHIATLICVVLYAQHIPYAVSADGSVERDLMYAAQRGELLGLVAASFVIGVSSFVLTRSDSLRRVVLFRSE